MYYVHIINVKNGILKFSFVALFIRLFVSGVIRYTDSFGPTRKIEKGVYLFASLHLIPGLA